MDRNALRNMTDIVARSLMNASSGDETAWDLANEEDRNLMRELAHAAMGAHDAALTVAGFKIIPPGTVQVPHSDEEAGAMIRAAQTYMESKAPHVVAPPKPGLVDVNGRKLN